MSRQKNLAIFFIGFLGLMVTLPIFAEETTSKSVPAKENQPAKSISLEVPPIQTGASLLSTPEGENIYLEITGKSKNTVVFVSGEGKVRVLHQGPLEAGRHNFKWDGKDNMGKMMDRTRLHTAGVRNEFINYSEGFFHESQK